MLYYVLAFCDPMEGEPAVATVEAFRTRGEADKEARRLYDSGESAYVRIMEVGAEYYVRTRTEIVANEYPSSWTSGKASDELL